MFPRPTKAPRVRARARALAAGALLAAALAGPGARAAVLLDGMRAQGSASSSPDLGDTMVTVGSAPNRLLMFGVSIAGTATSVSSIVWRGQAATLVIGQSVSIGVHSCRVELWRLVNPSPGTGFVTINLSAPAAFGLGVASYSGVDQQRPTGTPASNSATGSPVQVEVPSTDGRPILGAACLGGNWIGGRTGGTGPDAVAASIDTSLWDFTENDIVGLGSHSGAFNGIARVRWDITYQGSFAWMAAGVSITPAAGSPDAGVDASIDVAPDVRPPDDPPPAPDRAAPDQTVVVPDASVDLATPAPDLTTGGDAVAGAPDAASTDAAAPVDAAAFDAAVPAGDAAEPDGPALDDAADGIRDANFNVGCACRTGGHGRTPTLLVALTALVGRRLSRRRCRSRRG